MCPVRSQQSSTVRSQMSRDLVLAETSEPIAEVARRMVANNVGAVLILDDRRLRGILTERDVVRALAAGMPAGADVGDWMTLDPETVEPDEPVRHAATLMLHGGFRHVPVVEGGEVVGMLSVRDLMADVLEDCAPRGV